MMTQRAAREARRIACADLFLGLRFVAANYPSRATLTVLQDVHHQRLLAEVARINREVGRG